jgi:hypothetical protein
VVVLGLQRIDGDGKILNTAWLASPADQPDYVTDGLLASAEDMRAACEIGDD